MLENAVFQTLRTIVGRNSEHVLYECRHCGTVVDDPGGECPDCGATEIARFHL